MNNVMGSTTERKPTSLLDIPPEIRQRIYRHTDLLSGRRLLFGPKYWLRRWSGLLDSWGCLTSLLLTCSTIKAEVECFLYENNETTVRFEHIYEGLDAITRLTPDQCRSLRNLYVQLHVSVRYSFMPGNSGLPIDSERIMKWQTAIRHVLSHANPKELSLHLICDTGASTETDAVLEPLLASPGFLKNFSLRLCMERVYDAITAARKAAARIEGRVETTKPFRFLDLPTELRMEVLEYTDLVTPYNEIQRDSQKGFCVLDPRFNCSEDPLKGEGKVQRTCHFFLFSCGSGWRPGRNNIFCDIESSGYSSHCRCSTSPGVWTPPGELMLVYRAMYEDAIRTLYHYNRIVIIPPGNSLPEPMSLDNAPTTSDAAQFILMHKKPHVLRYLRNIEIFFPQRDPSFFPQLSSPFYTDWEFAINRLREHGNLRALSFTIHFNLSNTFKETEKDPWLTLDTQTEFDESPKHMKLPEIRLLIALRKLPEMRGLFIHLDWLRYWTLYHKRFSIDWDVEEKLRQHPRTDHQNVESWLERIVMGEDYDSSAIGKSKEQPNEWFKSQIRLRKRTGYL
ncbi:hypothetical protein GGR55DRAFT_701831 [Xylaria sp. FL0064]|nr:hypothetical protein GGR55DRAFT_701831 [Xylaria sp. FL0064]